MAPMAFMVLAAAAAACASTHGCPLASDDCMARQHFDQPKSCSESAARDPPFREFYLSGGSIAPSLNVARGVEQGRVERGTGGTHTHDPVCRVAESVSPAGLGLLILGEASPMYGQM